MLLEGCAKNGNEKGFSLTEIGIVSLIIFKTFEL
jgi:hypothetical protein